MTSGVLLHRPLPAGTLDLGCGPAGEVELVGVVTSTNNLSFALNRVQIFGCVGTATIVVADWVVPYIGDVAYFGKGFGAVSVSTSHILAARVSGGTTSVDGNPASGSRMDFAEVSGITSELDLIGGGAFTGTGDVTGVWYTKNVSVTSVCTATDTGVVSSGSLISQPIATSMSLTTCPPTSLGPQPATVTLTIGAATNPIYTGHGSEIIRFCVPWGS